VTGWSEQMRRFGRRRLRFRSGWWRVRVGRLGLHRWDRGPRLDRGNGPDGLYRFIQGHCFMHGNDPGCLASRKVRLLRCHRRLHRCAVAVEDAALAVVRGLGLLLRGPLLGLGGQPELVGQDLVLLSQGGALPA